MTFTLLENGTITSPRGYTAGAAACGIKKNGKLDVALLLSEVDCSAAGVFTRNQVQAAPVLIDRETLAANPTRIRGVVANSGNANACTGQPGLESGLAMQRRAAAAAGCLPEQILILSTGVIGVPLPMARLFDGIAAAAADCSPANGHRAAEGICTTDTFVKEIAVEVPLAAGPVRIGGMAKGAGMIHPNMATMLAVITTDARIEAGVLPGLLHAAANVSFNSISVDGDTSTNDTVLLLANGMSGIEIDPGDWSIGSDYALFNSGLEYVCQELAKMIVRDGEGASKFIELKVSGTRTRADAHQIANTIATSPLVKTAFAGSDANWGRIFEAAGLARIHFDQTQTDLRISADGEEWLTLLQAGTPADYREADAAAIFAERDIHVWLHLEEGLAEAVVWTCDLTHDYVSINADYRT